VIEEALRLLAARDRAEDRLETLLREAEDSGPAAEMTAQDWDDIRTEGLARLKTHKATREEPATRML
jgi:hypothetical protein